MDETIRDTPSPDVDSSREPDASDAVAATLRRWDVASIAWSRVATLLDQGWEPFAVVQREPNSKFTTTEATVYLRRERTPDVEAS